MSVKCKEFLAQHHQKNNDGELLLHQEINVLKNDWIFLQSEIEKLNEKIDLTFGLLPYNANQYDDFSADIQKLSSQNEIPTQELRQCNQNVEQIHKQQMVNEEQLDSLEQYKNERREILEIHGIPYSENESRNDIVLKIAEVLKVQLQPNDISTSQRLFNPKQLRDHQHDQRKVPNNV